MDRPFPPKTLPYTIMEAGPEHTQALDALYRSITYDGPIDVQFLRGRDPYTSLRTEGQDSVILVAQDHATGDIFSMGACCIHEMYLHGKPVRVGYCNGLKVHPRYQKRTTLLPRAFTAMGEALQGRAELCFGSILQSAEDTRRIFERRRPHMPAYVRQCTYTTFCFRPARRTGGLTLEQGNPEGLAAFYAKHGSGYNLMPTAPIRGTSYETMLVWRENGIIRGACAVHDEQPYKEYRLRAYHGSMRWLRYLPVQLLGYPGFPKEGALISHAAISMLLFAPDVPEAQRTRFLRAASSCAGDRAMCMVGLTDTDPTYRAAGRLRHIKYSSVLYAICWGEEPDLSDRPIYCDVALM